MKTIDEQIECAKALLASLEEQKAQREANAIEQEMLKAWKPKEGDTYYSFDSSGEVSDSIWDNDVYDVKRYAFGNAYKTREEADFEVECRKVETELRRYIYEHGGGDGKFIADFSNYHICYNHEQDALELFETKRTQTSEIYCNNYKILRDAINAIGADRIKKYYLRVKETE